MLMTEERQERSNLFCSSVGREDYDLCRVTGRPRQVRDLLFSRSNLHIFTFTLPRWLSALNRGRDRSTQSPSDLSRRCPEALSSSLERFGQTSNNQITILTIFRLFLAAADRKGFLRGQLRYNRAEMACEELFIFPASSRCAL